MSNWIGFFQIQAGASASLLGLIFVSLSISLGRIVASRYLPNRALESLIVLFLNLLVSSLFLVPEQPVTRLAVEILSLVVVAWAAVTMLHVQSIRKKESSTPRRAHLSVALGQWVAVSWLVAGGMLVVNGANSLAWFIPAFFLSYLLALVNAWVLLVEINR